MSEEPDDKIKKMEEEAISLRRQISELNFAVKTLTDEAFCGSYPHRLRSFRSILSRMRDDVANEFCPKTREVAAAFLNGDYALEVKDGKADYAPEETK